MEKGVGLMLLGLSVIGDVGGFVLDGLTNLISLLSLKLTLSSTMVWYLTPTLFKMRAN